MSTQKEKMFAIEKKMGSKCLEIPALKISLKSKALDTLFCNSEHP